MSTPALLAISHGTASAEGQAAIRRLVDAVAAQLPGVTVRLGHVDVQQPDVAASLASIPEPDPVVIVPLLLSAGYHVRVDLRKQSAGRSATTIAPALGPDPRLIDVLVARLGAAGLEESDWIVLAVAGSSDERANDDCRVIGAMLAERLGRDVTVGFLAAAEPRLGGAVAEARGALEAREARNPGEARAHGIRPRVIVANYLLAPGYFHDLAVRLADGAPVARPLLDADAPPGSLVDLVVERYRTAVAAKSSM